jgi:hypothetical protein
VKQGKINTISIYCQAVSFLLIILFLSISVVQIFHSHKTVIKTEQSDEESDGLVTEKCKICDFIIHKHGKAIHLSYTPVISAPLPEPVSYNTFSYIGNYKFTLQGFTNKGPPSLLA